MRRVIALDDCDRLSLLLAKAEALTGVLSSATLSDDPPSEGETNWALQIVQDMLRDARQITNAAQGVQQ